MEKLLKLKDLRDKINRDKELKKAAKKQPAAKDKKAAFAKFQAPPFTQLKAEADEKDT